MNRYIGITIGPIVNTMNLVSTPAALWSSSYLFSFISRTICQTLTETFGLPSDHIIVPYYDPSAPLPNDGVGRFHDRIIFRVPEGAEDFLSTGFAQLKETVLRSAADKFNVSHAFLQEYIHMTGVMYQADNAILGSAKPLDSTELSFTFRCTEDENELLKVFSGGSDQRNAAIKQIARDNLGIDPAAWQLLRGENIKSLGDIASAGRRGAALKKHRYYAVVRADGDRMSQIIASLGSDEAVRGFSRACLDYCTRISEAVRAHNGMTVYAGGDDLLAIMPCAPTEQTTILNFVDAANKVFRTCFADYLAAMADAGQRASLSWGILICYDRHPLYEALSESAHLLFAEAKHPDLKDCIAIRLLKHSGQTAQMLIPNASLPSVLALQQTVLSTVQPDEQMMLNVLYTLSEGTSIALFDHAPEDHVGLLFENLFDGCPENYKPFLYQELPKLFLALKTEHPVYLNTARNANPTGALCQLLRLMKFFTEKAGEDR